MIAFLTFFTQTTNYITSSYFFSFIVTSFWFISSSKNLYVAIKIIATGSDTTIPQNPPKIPPANTAKIFTNAGNWFVLPYTLGPIIYPAILGHIMQTKIV